MKYIIEIEEKPLCVFDKDTQTYFPRLWRVKGFNSLVFDEDGLSRLEELNSDYINEHFGELQDEAYQKGFEDGKNSIDMGCEGCRYSLRFAKDEPCKSCSNCYKSKYEPMPKEDDSIKVGDEVVTRGVIPGNTFLVTKVTESSVYGISNDGSWNFYNKDSATKTGKHYDIQSILEAMKEHDFERRTNNVIED